MEFIKANGKMLQTASGSPILLRGFGLGGWLLPEGYMWKLFTKCDRPRRMEKLIEGLCGKKFSVEFWRRYFAGYITKRDIELISQQGFNSVRLPMNARHLNEETLKRIDDLISWCRAYDVYVILDMHGAPGGQTGTNIDDCENDTPQLFIEESYQDSLVALWRSLAGRYANEPAVAGFDLLNEPLPNWFLKYNPLLMPLYRRITSAIRMEDTQHLIILEGVHWATDWSVFEELTEYPVDDNIMLQFHKYWNSPDAESITPYTALREKLNMPVFMGEGGENNLEWYTGMFSMLERENISWSFWTYKKMNCSNSPVSFSQPKEWYRIISYIDGGMRLSEESAKEIFNEFLENIDEKAYVNKHVFCALKHEAPVMIPAEYFSQYHITGTRTPGADLRLGTPVNIRFISEKTGVPDYKRYGGEEQPEEERICVALQAGEWLQYNFSTAEEGNWCIKILCKSEAQTANFVVQIDNKPPDIHCATEEWVELTLSDIMLKDGSHKLKIQAENNLLLQNWKIY